MLIQEPTISPPDPRFKRSRQMLIEAFVELLREKPFDTITVHDITARAALNRVTFYNHFPDKSVLVDESIQQMIQLAIDEKLPANSDLHPDNICLLIQIVCEFLALLQDYCVPSNRSQFDTLVAERVKGNIQSILLRWLAEGAPPNSANYLQAELQATVTSWAIYGAAQKWTNTEYHEPAAAYAQRIYPLILSAIGFTEA